MTDNNTNENIAAAPSSEDKALLVVASKVKAYAKTKGASISAEAMVTLTELIERECDKAIDLAKADGRKIVKARDFQY